MTVQLVVAAGIVCCTLGAMLVAIAHLSPRFHAAYAEWAATDATAVLMLRAVLALAVGCGGLAAWFLGSFAGSIGLFGESLVTGHALGGWHHLYVGCQLLAFVLLFMQLPLWSAVSAVAAVVLVFATCYEVVAAGAWLREGAFFVGAGAFFFATYAISVALAERRLADARGVVSNPVASARLTVFVVVAMIAVGVYAYWSHLNIVQANEAIHLRNQSFRQ